MTTKKELNLKTKKELIDLIYKFQQFFFSLEREISHEVYEDILEGMYFEALDGKIPQADWFGATRFADKFNQEIYQRVNKIAEYSGVREILSDRRFDFCNWYIPIDIFRERKNKK
ncbi:hypothetical protein HY357_02835 [Candidatus Roizmanbacteria bacterium]|nr:hypothetical protein [Candidatus Roizmanbacteria bacterium]